MSNKRSLAAHLRYLCILLLAHILIYWEYWSLRKLFTGADFFRQLAPLLNFQSDCLREFSWPLWNPFMNLGYPWVEHYLNSSFFLTHLALGFLTKQTVFTAQIELLAWIVAGGAGVYLCAMQYGASKRAALISGLSFIFCGQITALPQWSNQIYNASLFPFLLLGYLKAKESHRALNLLSVFALSMTIFGGYIAATVLELYLFSVYVLIDSILNKNKIFGLKFLTITLITSFMLTLPKTLPFKYPIEQSTRFALDQSSENPMYGVVTAYQLMSFLLPVKYYFSLFIGQLGVIAFIHALTKRRFTKNALLLGMAVGCALFLIVDSEGTYSAFRNIANNIMPFAKNIRFSFMYWYFPLTFSILYVAPLIEEFLQSEKKFVLVSVIIFNIILTALFFLFFNTSLHYKAFVFHAALSFLWFLPAVLTWPQWSRTSLAILIVLVEFWMVFNRVNIDTRYTVDGQNMEIAVTHQNITSASFADAELVRETWKERITSDKSRPSIDDSRKNPYIVYGSNNHMLAQVAESMNQKKFSIIWYNSQERNDFKDLKKKLGTAWLEGSPLFYFETYSGSSAEHEIFFQQISCSEFGFQINSAAPGLFQLNQMYDDRWHVYVDGKEEELSRTNFFFMGAYIGSGTHSVKFVFRDMIFMTSTAISLAALTMLIAFAIIGRTHSR